MDFWPRILSSKEASKKPDGIPHARKIMNFSIFFDRELFRCQRSVCALEQVFVGKINLFIVFTIYADWLVLVGLFPISRKFASLSTSENLAQSWFLRKYLFILISRK